MSVPSWRNRPLWVLCELRAICRRLRLSVRGNKVDVLAPVLSHVASK